MDIQQAMGAGNSERVLELAEREKKSASKLDRGLLRALLSEHNPDLAYFREAALALIEITDKLISAAIAPIFFHSFCTDID